MEQTNTPQQPSRKKAILSLLVLLALTCVVVFIFSSHWAEISTALAQLSFRQVLLVLAMLLWVMRKLNVLYVPGLSMILLAVSMIIVGIMMFQIKEKKKMAGTLILAFGLFCIVAAIMEIKGYFA